MTASPAAGSDDTPWEVDPPRPEPGDSEGETYRLAGGYTAADTIMAPVPVMPIPEPRKLPQKRKRGADFWPLMGFNLLVFVSSVCVMTLEVVASRLVGKHVGNSLYTWTSVIGVVLAGITAGNYLGGYIADRYDRRKALSWTFLVASVLCASVLWIDLQLASIERPASFSWPMWVLTVVASLFLLPSIALGAASPLVASMAIARSSRTGATVGNIYAWGAFGSIVGTFLTGFYLIDTWGTRSIIGGTAAVLALQGVVIASGQWVFRTAVVLGWLQTLGLLVAASTGTGALYAGAIETWYGRELTPLETGGRWQTFARTVGDRVHELGLALQLRDDSPGRYYDESQYSYIEVGDDLLDGEPVKYLRLDKLIHSYYNPEDPTALHYEYEKVYAAVTKRVAGTAQPVSVPLKPFPGWDDLRGRLPAGVTWDEFTQQLQASRPTEPLLQQLLHLSPDAGFWDVVDQLQRETSRPGWGGFTAVPLDQLPEALRWPAELEPALRYDDLLHNLTARTPLTRETRDRLVSLTRTAPWHAAVTQLRTESRRVNALFLGGGGFIFPRWVLEQFPGSQRLDVAELDPAVLKAVVQEFGFSATDQQRISTTLGDARNFVEDRYRQNEALKREGKVPELYDFIYGDAFNDFSIPWHLTTREFTQRMQSLLSENGVLQANIIEIYPRTPFPGTLVESAAANYPGALPSNFRKRSGAEFIDKALHSELSRLTSADAPSVGYDLQFRGRMSDALRDALQELDKNNVVWKQTIDTLCARTRQFRPYEGVIPPALLPESLLTETWNPCPAAYQSIEIRKQLDGSLVLAVRGALPPALRQKLLALAPNDSTWTTAVDELDRLSHRQDSPGQFLGRYTNTCATLFPNLYLFSTAAQFEPQDGRDTFVLVCSNRPLNLDHLQDTGDWSFPPFARRETLQEGQSPVDSGHMSAILELARGQILTDDFAPVDTLLRPVFTEQFD